MEKDPDIYSQKLELLDKLFNAVSIDTIKEFAGHDLSVAILKGEDVSRPGPFSDARLQCTRLQSENNSLRTDISILRNDLMMLRNDVQTLLRVMNQPQFSQTASFDFQTLRMRHNIY